MTDSAIKVALLGAGYISTWHVNALKRVKNVEISAVCDLSESAAHALANPLGATVYTDLEDMLENDPCDAVHVLTPPHLHVDPARAIMNAGRHCYIEKPVCLSSSQAEELGALAREKNVRLGVAHNFLMLPSYEKMKRDIHSGKIGMLDHVQLNWRFPLAPLRSGPYGLWMLRNPENILFEIGSHLFAFIADMFEELDNIQVRLRYPITIPGDITHFQGWTITGEAGSTSVTADISLIEGHDDRSISVRGSGAVAHYSFAQDSYCIERTPMQDIVVGPLLLQLSGAFQATKNGVVNSVRQFTSLNMLAPYGLSLTRGAQKFYEGLTEGRKVDDRLSIDLASRALSQIEDVIDIAGPMLEEAQKPKIEPAEVSAGEAPTVLVIGGTGFIGRYTCHALADAGYSVRVLSRGRVSGFEREDNRITGFTGDLKSQDDMLAALKGIKTVYNFARATESSWEGYLENDVAVAKHVGECCLKAGVERLIYTGTISCYDTSRRETIITEDVGFDANLEERDLYSRSKAKCEEVLFALHKEKSLPLVVARPGIVIGEGGPLQHWGIAMWRSSTACKMWGHGKNNMPFVLVEDVAAALVNMMTVSDIEGESFNLVGAPLLSSRDYFAAISNGYGVQMRALPTPTWRYFLVDMMKYGAKKFLARRQNLTKPTLRDWQSRAQVSSYNNEKPKRILNWQPEEDRADFIRRGITGIALFGVQADKIEIPFVQNSD